MTLLHAWFSSPRVWHRHKQRASWWPIKIHKTFALSDKSIKIHEAFPLFPNSLSWSNRRCSCPRLQWSNWAPQPQTRHWLLGLGSPLVCAMCHIAHLVWCLFLLVKSIKWMALRRRHHTDSCRMFVAVWLDQCACCLFLHFLEYPTADGDDCLPCRIRNRNIWSESLRG